MKLNYKQQGTGQTILFLHGVLGSLDNLNLLANTLAKQYQTIQVDLRNHGRSPWSDEMDFSLMADDIVELCHDLDLNAITIIGHSMGGKVAMQLTQVAPHLIHQVVILDIAPVKYTNDANLIVFKTLAHCIQQQLTDKNQIAKLMEYEGLTKQTCQFLLKSFKENQWLFNFNAINNHYSTICDWQSLTPWLNPILFIRGSQSDYILDSHYSEMLQQFPYLEIETVQGAGHNLHVEKPDKVLSILQDWLIKI